jgi:AraC-like DNA-binding protein
LSQPATVRAAALTGFRALCRAYGLDPVPLLHAAGLPARAEADPDQRLPAAAVNRLLEQAAEASGAEDFGLRLAELRGFSNLGLVTVLARDEPDMRSALDVFIAYLPLHNEALDIALSLEGDVAILMCRIMTPGRKTQAIDVAVAMLYRILRQLLGSDWVPQMVALERPAPARAGHFQRVFGGQVAFGQDFSGVVFDPGDLARSNLLADADLRRYTAGLRRSLAHLQDEPLSARVQRLQRTALAGQRCTAPAIAARLGLSRRSLDRGLAAEGTSFHALLDAVRRESARDHVEASRRSMTEIAGMLGFASSAAFNAWFATRWGQPPGRWRRQQLSGTAFAVQQSSAPSADSSVAPGTRPSG